jgi:hypothetical protein
MKRPEVTKARVLIPDECKKRELSAGIQDQPEE